MKKLLIVLLLVLAAGSYFGYRHWRASTTRPAAVNNGPRLLYYHCPMHPDYHSDHPGKCPICGMTLEPVYATTPSAGPTSTAGQIHVSPERQQMIGVRLGEVTMESPTRTIRVVGKVAMDETRVVKVHPRVDGWIESVQADFLGQLVREGQPLVSIYSPELFATEQEYLLALRAKDIMSHSSMSGMTADSDSLVEAARRRLELWDLSPAQIDELHHARKPSATVTLYSPAAGYVIARNAFQKQRITPETELYTIADLSRVWVMADIFEADIPSIALGQPARVALAYPSTRSFPAKVDYIQPAVDPATRTLKVRLALDNSGMMLKPEMFAAVEFRCGGARRLMVPSDAVLDSGLSKTVFVERGEGYFEPRAVETGDEFGDKIEIAHGLAVGERIVTSGTFMLDSESQLKAVTREMHTHDQPSH